MRNKIKTNRDVKQRAKRLTAQAVFALLSLMLMSVYTLIFGTKESPWENTLSGIGNSFNHRLSFIFWGLITGMSILYYTLYIFEKMDFANKRARRYLISSQAFLIFTVFIPALKSVFPFWHFIHVLCTCLFALFFIISILLFIQYLAKSNQRLSKTALFLFLSCVGVSILALFIMGLNGVVEILFFVGISIFLAILGVILNRFRKLKEIEEQTIEIVKAKKDKPDTQPLKLP